MNTDPPRSLSTRVRVQRSPIRACIKRELDAQHCAELSSRASAAGRVKVERGGEWAEPQACRARRGAPDEQGAAEESQGLRQLPAVEN